MPHLFDVFAASTSPQWTDIGNFLAQGAAAIVALVIGSLQLRKPRPQLLYRVYERPVNQLHDLIAAGVVQVLCPAGLVSDPHLVNIMLNCRVSGGIDKNLFNNNKPIQFDVGVPIQGYGQASRPEEQPCPQSSRNGNILEVGPDYFMDGQVVIFTLVVEGPPCPKGHAISPFSVLRLKRGRQLGPLMQPILAAECFLLAITAPPACGVVVAAIAHQKLGVASALLLAIFGALAGIFYLIAHRTRPH